MKTLCEMDWVKIICEVGKTSNPIFWKLTFKKIQLIPVVKKLTDADNLLCFLKSISLKPDAVRPSSLNVTVTHFFYKTNVQSWSSK